MKSRILLFIVLMSLAVATYASTKRALVIGVGAYPKGSGWAVIHGDNDIPLITDMLKKNGYKYIKTMRNEEATKVNIKAAIAQLTMECQPGDKVYIHFSGHGQQVVDVSGDEDDRLDEAWIPYDAKARYVAGQYEGENHILDDELNVWFSVIADKIGKNGHLTVSVDACHSGDGSRALEGDSICIRGAFEDGTRGFDTFFNAVKDWLSGEDGEEMPVIKEVRWTMISACKPEQTNREYNGCGSLSSALHEISDKIGTMTAEQVRVQVRNWMKSRFGDYQLPAVNQEMKNQSFF